MTERKRVTAMAGGRRLVKQSMAGESDINEIMKKWHATGMLPQSGRQPKYGDFSTGQDFTQAMNAVRDMEESFEQLPSAVRRVCHNNPAVFLELVAKPESREFLKEHGLIEERIPPVVRVLGGISTDGSPGSSPGTAQGAAKAP